MSIDWMDDFGMYGTGTVSRDNMLNGIYATVGGLDNNTYFVQVDPDPSAVGSFAYKANAASGSITMLRRVLSSGETTVGVALRLWSVGLPPSAATSFSPIAFSNGANNILCCLWLTTTGALQVQLNRTDGLGTVIGVTDGPIIVSNAWQHVEMKVLFSATVGTIEVRVEGITVIDESGIDTIGTATGPCEQVRQDNSGGSNISWYFKDYIIWNGSGTQNVSFLGTCSVVDLTTTADVSLNWTPSTGTTGFNLIDETPPNDDTDYISAADPPPAAAVFALSNLDIDVTSVKGLMTLVRARKTDGGDGNLQVGLISGASTVNGSDRPITSAYTYWSDVFELDPATAAPWTPTAVNAVNLRIDRTI